MGDADNTQNMMSVEEVEAMMENAWNDLDDGLDGLFSFVNLLNEHDAYIMSEIASCQRLRRWFVALNLFVIPIMLSIWIAFGSTDFVAPDSEAEAVLQTIVMALMVVSGGIGFPFYVLALWRAAFGDGKAVEGSPCLRLGSEAAEIRRASPAAEGSETSFPFGVDSLERVTELARQTNRRFLDNVRQDLERRGHRGEEAEQSGSSRRLDTSDNNGNDRVPVTEQQLVDLNAGGLPAHKEETDFCGFKVIILNKTQDLSVEIEKQEEALPFPNEESRLTDFGDEYRPNSVRSIAVENVGEGDSRKICSKDCWQEETFGL